MTPLLLVCSLCLPAHAAPSPAGAARLELAADPAEVVAPPPGVPDGTVGGASASGGSMPALGLTKNPSGSDEELSPPPSWQSWSLMGAMGAFAIGGNAIAAERGFNIGRLVLDETSMVLGASIGIAGTIAASFLLGPKEGGLLLPLSERKLFTVLLVGGIIGSVGALAAAEAIGGHLDHPLGLLGAAGGFVVTSGVIIALVDGIFGLPVWANALMLPLGLVGGSIGGYSLAIPRR